MKMPRRHFLLGSSLLALSVTGRTLTKVSKTMEYDVLIVGGGVAGLSAALGLGRCRRKVLVCSSGPPRNAPAGHSHTFLTRDGTPPGELLAISREQLKPYTSVEIRDCQVLEIDNQDRFTATLSDGSTVQARQVILATGMRDDLNSLPGLEKHWGKDAFACPFCHGWEARDTRWAVMVNEPIHFAAVKLALSWTRDIVVVSQKADALDPAQQKALEQRAIPFARSPVVQVLGEKRLQGLLLADNSRLACDALNVRPPFSQRSPLPASLGCELDEFGCVKVNFFQSTNIVGVFAVGDMTTMMHSLAAAVAGGNKAAGGVQHALCEEDFASST